MKIHLLYMHDHHEYHSKGGDDLVGGFLSRERALAAALPFQLEEYPALDDYHHGGIHFYTRELDIPCGDKIIIPMTKAQWLDVHIWLSNGTSMCMCPADETFQTLDLIEEVFPEWDH